jgi:hypothetical protein
MAKHVSFHRLEDYENRLAKNRGEILVSFETRQHGYYQIRYKKLGEDTHKLDQLRNEPDLMMFTDSERYYIECVCALVYRMVFHASKPKALSDHRAY